MLILVSHTPKCSYKQLAYLFFLGLYVNDSTEHIYLLKSFLWNIPATKMYPTIAGYILVEGHAPSALYHCSHCESAISFKERTKEKLYHWVCPVIQLFVSNHSAVNRVWQGMR
ncbi:MAG: hypothetical protein G01um101433_281 [Parcubacteria group bacterium Gr01-1014_33]|nr:MAG: hypothetical protein G01um101433_281 [Parcubacteria group bacterium Gr01-1014_33]